MAGILGWLGLENYGVPDVSTMIAQRGGKLLPEVEPLLPMLAARLCDTYCEFGYLAGA